MKLLITGGAGFIGSHICNHAMAAGIEVAIVDDLSSGKRENVPRGTKLFVMDIRDRDALGRAFRDFRPDVVSHQAAQSSVSVSVREPSFDASVNVVGSVNVLDACLEYGIERFVFASTGGAIYGEVGEGERASVDHPARPESPYAAGKLAVEGYLRFYAARGLGCHVLRYANVYGPRQDPHGEAGVVAIFVERLLAARPVRVNAQRERGDAGCVRDYVFVDDVARANLAAIRGTLDTPVLNVGTGEGTATRTLLERIIEALGPELERRRVARPEMLDAAPRAGDVERSVLDVVAFVERFGSPTPLCAGLEHTIADRLVHADAQAG